MISPRRRRVCDACDGSGVWPAPASVAARADWSAVPCGRCFGTGSRLRPRDLGINPKALGTNARALGNNPKALGVNPRALGIAPTQIGTNPRALGTNPRALGVSPRQLRRRGLI